MTPHLPDLLKALAHLFARPGGFPGELFHAGQAAPWLPEAAIEPLRQLASAHPDELAVEYASHFLVGRTHPTLHLEEGAARLGRLADPDLNAEFQATYAAWGFAPTGPTEHLATQLDGLSELLRGLAGSADSDPGVSLPAGLHLLDEHTLPFLDRLCESRIDGPYGAALNLTRVLLQEVREALHELSMNA